MSGSPPFFNDFIKKTKDFFKRDKYDFGDVVEVKHRNHDVQFTAKAKQSGDACTAKLTGLFRQPWGSVELSQDSSKGSTLELKKNNLFSGVSGRFKRTANEFEATLDTKKSFWNAKAKCLYQPDKGGFRVCSTTLSAAVGDDSLNLSVGGEATIEDRGKAGTAMQPALSTFGLGFLYEPSRDSNYSLIFRPQRKQDGLTYSLTMMRTVQFEDAPRADLCARVEGNVDLKIAGQIPTASLALRSSVRPGLTLSTFVNSNAEWGANYKFSIPADKLNIRAQIGVSSFSSKGADQRFLKFGYKVTIE